MEKKEKGEISQPTYYPLNLNVFNIDHDNTVLCTVGSFFFFFIVVHVVASSQEKNVKKYLKQSSVSRRKNSKKNLMERADSHGISNQKKSHGPHAHETEYKYEKITRLAALASILLRWTHGSSVRAFGNWNVRQKCPAANSMSGGINP